MEESYQIGSLRERALRLCNRYAVVLQFFACLILYFIIECMARHSPAQAAVFFDHSTKIFVYNTILIFITTLPAFLFRRRTFWRALIFAVWLVLGAANGILLANRVTPLTGPDLNLIIEGVAVFGKYLSKSTEILLIGVLITIAIVFIILFFKGPIYRGKRNLRIIVPCILAACVGFYGLTHLYYNTKQLSTYFGNIAFAYQDYGFPYCLCITVTDTGIEKPWNYSEELVRGIVDQEGDPAVGQRDDLPNIIIVQLESFFDPKAVRYLEFSEDPLPNWHALSEAYTSGLYTVPTIGAGTVNTEFETLTGMSLRYFGSGEYPYKGILKEEACESAAYVLDNLGLTAHAVHNNYATFYSRKSVYPNLGFRDFTSNEYMDNQNDVNEIGWMRDRTLLPYINKCLDATNTRDFIFAVSVQGHGAYPAEDEIESPAIEVTGAESEEKNCQWEYYVNQIHEMDQFVRNLIDTMEARGEPTVIMFYGDHLPTMGLADNDLTVGSTFQTRYLMWDNIGLPQEKKDIASYQAVAELFDRLDLHTGTMFRFHQTEQESKLYQMDMQTLQYDILYGEKYVYGQSSPYERVSMKMGINTPVLDSLEVVTDTICYVHGEHFTQSSKLLIDDEECPTFFVDSHTLLITSPELENGQMIKVGQLSNSGSGKYLSYTNMIRYAALQAQPDEDIQGTSGVAQANPADRLFFPMMRRHLRHKV